MTQFHLPQSHCIFLHFHIIHRSVCLQGLHWCYFFIKFKPTFITLKSYFPHQWWDMDGWGFCLLSIWKRQHEVKEIKHEKCDGGRGTDTIALLMFLFIQLRFRQVNRRSTTTVLMHPDSTKYTITCYVWYVLHLTNLRLRCSEKFPIIQVLVNIQLSVPKWLRGLCC